MVTWGDPELSCCDSSTISFITGEYWKKGSMRECHLEQVLKDHIIRKYESLVIDMASSWKKHPRFLSFMIYLTSIKTESMIWKSTIPSLDSYSFIVTALDRGSPAGIDLKRTGGWKCSLQLLLHTWLILPIRSSNLGESFISLLVLHFCTHRLVVLEPLQTLEEVVTSLEPYLRSLWAGGSWLLHTAGLCKAQKRLMWRAYRYKQWWLLH